MKMPDYDDNPAKLLRQLLDETDFMCDNKDETWKELIEYFDEEVGTDECST